jgi:L,D-peptidoglycan transpeptidase YkuD (ErfK/YbiS/YcfS/YnhG family)
MHILIKNKFLIYGNYKVKCAIGKRGISKKRKEGDLITPKGNYSIKKLFYRKDRVKSLKTKLKKNIINKNYGWCDDPKSKKYNQLIRYPFNYSCEKLYREDRIYDIILVLDYNINPIKKNMGSAIFIHVAKNNYNRTKGCVAIKKKSLRKLVQLINKNTKVKIS